MNLTKNNYFVLTGAMGGGKTAILNKLKERGYACEEEQAREIIKEQVKIGGDATPNKNAGKFNELLLKRMIARYNDNINNAHIIIFDRGIPDCAGYADLFNIDRKKYLAAAEEYNYNKHVFMFNGWEEIYINDTERKMSFDAAKNFGINIRKIYEDLGYELSDVPFVSADERVEFIVGEIEKLSQNQFP